MDTPSSEAGAFQNQGLVGKLLTLGLGHGFVVGAVRPMQRGELWLPTKSSPRPPNVPLLRAIWSLLDGIWGLLKGSWGVLAEIKVPKYSVCQVSM